MVPERAGFIGLGRMGAALAERLQSAGVPLTVFDVRPENAAPFLDAGAEAAQSPRAVADRASVVFSCLPTTRIAVDVALGPDGVAGGHAVQVYVDTATIGMKVAQEIAAGLPETIGFIDAPVSGGPVGARAGTLSTMASGSRAAYERAHPLLSILAKSVFYIGERPGQAQIAKLVNNHLSAAGRLATFEGLVLALKAGIDPMAMIDVLNASSGRNHTTTHKIPAALESGSFSYGARLANSIKDETLLRDEADALGVPLWVAPRLLETLKEAAEAGYQDQDSMFLIQFMGERAGIDVRALMQRDN
jgi:3-hydroxyisobutyrate dehydrogenase-like beta-hydroxyacid dehydrogenase